MRSPPPLTIGFYPPQAKTAGRPRSGQSHRDTLYSETDASKTLIRGGGGSGNLYGRAGRAPRSLYPVQAPLALG